MSKLPPSIFNDVIGPVMRGPSSSHTAASIRIARMARSLIGIPIKKASFEFDPRGSLATTYDGQGSDIGLASGFLGFDMRDERIKDSLNIAKESGLEMEFIIREYENNHPNTYKMTLTGIDHSVLHLTAISTGGGMMEYIEMEGFPISSMGDYYEAFVLFGHSDELNKDFILQTLEKDNRVDFVKIQENNGRNLLHVKSSSGSCNELVHSISIPFGDKKIYDSEPVMPVLSRKNLQVPFISAAQALEYAEGTSKESWEIAALYESERGNLPISSVLEMMTDIVTLMDDSIRQGLEGTYYADRILGHQSHLIGKAESEGKLLPIGMANKVMAATMAMMEMKSSMGLIVAAPTAGACAALPGVLVTTGKELGLDHAGIAKAMLVSGLVGVFIAEYSTFAAEVCGCQAETGSAAGMSAAGLVQMAGGTLKQSFDAASMALQNIFGLACDMIGNRVEVACLGKNIQATVNALTMANMALAGIESVIPLDEVIVAMDETGRSIPSAIRCTGYGGLCLTPTAKKLEEMLKKNRI